MSWELLAIWAIVITTLAWFRRDEQRLRAERLAVKARQYALAPAYRHEVRTGPDHKATPPQASAHKAYLDLLQQTRRERNSGQARL